MDDQIPTPRSDAHFLRRLKEHGTVDKRDERFARQLERESAVTMARLTLWRDRAFEANNSDEFVEIDNLIGELKDMRRAYEEGR